jgi:hypothetical protein
MNYRNVGHCGRIGMRLHPIWWLHHLYDDSDSESDSRSLTLTNDPSHLIVSLYLSSILVHLPPTLTTLPPTLVYY